MVVVAVGPCRKAATCAVRLCAEPWTWAPSCAIVKDRFRSPGGSPIVECVVDQEPLQKKKVRLHAFFARCVSPLDNECCVSALRGSCHCVLATSYWYISTTTQELMRTVSHQSPRTSPCTSTENTHAVLRRGRPRRPTGRTRSAGHVVQHEAACARWWAVARCSGTCISFVGHALCRRTGRQRRLGVGILHRRLKDK